MNTLVILLVIVGVTLAQQGDTNKDCEPRQSSVSVRDVQDIYQRPLGYDTLDYSPHSTYGPPDAVRPAPRRNYPQDILTDGGSAPQPAYVRPPSYDSRQQFPLAPVYGPPPPRARVAAAAGIYDDYDDTQYAQPAEVVPVSVRRYNVNYAQREPYQSNYGYDVYPSRRHEYRVPVYYAPLPAGYYPVRLGPPTPVSTAAAPTRTTTTEESTPVTLPPTKPLTQPEHGLYDETQVKRYPPIITSSSDDEVIPRHHPFRKPFSGIANLFRGSIISTRNKIGLIPSIVQGSVNKFT